MASKFRFRWSTIANIFAKDTTRCLVYGYGSYGASIDADFSFSRSSLLNCGFVYAIVHVRGGGELGQQWYQDQNF
ncbi:prolyl oligopeptidase family serine peptidase [Escherichia coli]